MTHSLTHSLTYLLTDNLKARDACASKNGSTFSQMLPQRCPLQYIALTCLEVSCNALWQVHYLAVPCLTVAVQYHAFQCIVDGALLTVPCLTAAFALQYNTTGEFPCSTLCCSCSYQTVVEVALPCGWCFACSTLLQLLCLAVHCSCIALHCSCLAVHCGWCILFLPPSLLCLHYTSHGPPTSSQPKNSPHMIKKLSNFS